MYGIWALCVHSAESATFDENTLAAVCAASRSWISPGVIAVLKGRILNAASRLPPDQLEELLERLQISDHASGTSNSGGTMELWKQRIFTILIDFLEYLEQHEVEVEETRNVYALTFYFLEKQCPPERAPLDFQRRFSRWVLNIANGPLKDHMLIPVVNFLWYANSVISRQIDDVAARQTIIEALEKYARRLPNDSEDRLLLNKTIITLRTA
ncbi:hypothetical protein FB451DRAFT_1420774 [Mycena latifolia]|nr:hypothetical protein FB451DRAFT_1420774 [Mycena latifolia]